MRRQRGSIGFNAVFIVLLVAIGVLGYMLWNRNHRTDDIHGFGASTPDVIQNTSVFTDGLTSPTTTTRDTTDDTGMGITETSVFYHDINGDGVKDRIIRSHHENGTAHEWDEYRVELANGANWRDITPDGFRTTTGAECSLQKLQFIFAPRFAVIKISRPWVDTWDTPSSATKTIYELYENQLVPTATTDMGVICDVSELFIKK